MKKKVISLLAVLALCLGAMCTPLAYAATNAADYAAVLYTQATSQPAGQKIAITGTPNYSATTSDQTTTWFGFDASDGAWYVAIDTTKFEAFKAAAPAQQMTIYGSYAGTLEANGLPTLNIQSGAVQIGDKLTEAADLRAAGQKTATSSTASTGKKTGVEVWIPTNGGTKYHSKASCSGMKDPKKVDLAVAEAQGYTACKKCH